MPKITLTQINLVNYDILKLYQLIAHDMGLSKWKVDRAHFDCCKICVARNIYDQMLEAAIKEYTPKYLKHDVAAEFNMMWCIRGPKVDETLSKNEIEYEEGFVFYTSVKRTV